MRKRLSVLSLLCVLGILFAGCSQNNPTTDNSSQSAKDVNAKPVDIDISEMSSTLAYAQVVKIMQEPDDFLDKTIKISGQYQSSFYEPTGLHYHWIVVGDESLCCQQGVEFLWNGAHKYPDDYPDAKTPIELLGVFRSYRELGETYYHLTVDSITILR